MERRDVLKSAATLATVSTVGLAGCSGDSTDGGENDTDGGGDGTATPEATPTAEPTTESVETSCRTPDGDLTAAFPTTEEYSQQNTVTQDSEEIEREGIVRVAFASYTGPDDQEFTIQLVEFESAAEATEQSREIINTEPPEGRVLGYLIVDNVIYGGTGPDEESLLAFLETSSLLSECVEANITFV